VKRILKDKKLSNCNQLITNFIQSKQFQFKKNFVSKKNNAIFAYNIQNNEQLTMNSEQYYYRLIVN